MPVPPDVAAPSDIRCPDSAGPPPRRAPLPLLGPLFAPLYRGAIARRNAAFDAGKNVTRFEIPVISIGNLSVGGTGKTPMVMHALRLLLEAGRRPCIAMRGYSKGGRPDETDAYARAFPDLPIVAQPDRASGLRALFSRTDSGQRPDCIILDDGFQHRQIARDLDVVLIDATPGRSVFDDRLLPAGYLREPVTSLRRAGAIVLTHAELSSPDHLVRLRTQISSHTAAPIAIARHIWTALKQRASSEDRMLPLETLSGRRVIGCCAIGHPDGFRRSLAAVVGSASPVLALPDHDPFSDRTVQSLTNSARSERADFIVVTDKDWSKLRARPDAIWPCPVVRPELAIVFDSGRDEFDRLVVGTAARTSKLP